MSGRAAVATRLREVDAAEWDALLAGFRSDDVYLGAAYVEAASLLEPARPAFLVHTEAGGHVGLPCLVREVPDGEGALDVVSPYPYGGAVALGPAPPVERFHALYERWCEETGVVTTFTRFHPLLGNQRHAPPEARLERLADAATWPLAGDDDLFAGMHRSHRNKCRKADRAGVAVSVETAPGRFDDFVALHADTMRRRNASSFYRFSPAYWDRLAGLLGERLVRLDARLDGELVATEICLAGPRWLHYHMGVASETGRSLGAANLLVYEAARWGRGQGFAELNLGSGLGGREDSLWEFKQRFSPHAGREFWIGKVVHDAAAYARLCGSPAALDGFFPAYRAAPAPETPEGVR